MAKNKPMSNEERLKRKRECEKRRRDKIKQDSEKLKALKENKHQIYLKAKEEGRVKMIKECNPREQRVIRKHWKENTKKRRDRLKAVAKTDALYRNNTLPLKSKEEQQEVQQELISPERANENKEKQESSQKKRGRKQVRRDRAVAYRKINKLIKQNENLTKKFNKYKKRYQRLLQKQNEKNLNELTPNSRVKNQLKRVKVNKVVRRKLLFAEAINDELQATFNTLKSQKEKQIFTKIINGKIIKKYRLLGLASTFLPKRLFLSNSKRLNTFTYERLQSKSKLFIKNKIDLFWKNDEYSSVCPGKKDFIKKGGVSKQKRLLHNTLKTLHLTFQNTQNLNISYSLFCKLRPFWVIIPNVRDRNTCMCIKHENMKLIIKKLNKLKVIKENTPEEVIRSLTCESQSEACFKKTCTSCQNNVVLYSEFDGNEPTEVEKWIHRKETRKSIKTKKDIVVQISVKEPQKCLIGELVGIFEEMQEHFLTHVLNIKHQFKAVNSLKKMLTEKDLLLHVDFSENFQCKYSCETQAVHFGASRQQVTLHTGMAYTKDFKEGFCTLSSSLRHDPSAILAHIKPIVQNYLNKFSEVTNLHFLSDSPSTQYRNKTMFFIISNCIPIIFPAIQKITWNYSESGHGKGAPDGIGAVIKRTADRIVAEGGDIPNFDTLLNVLFKKMRNIHMIKINEELIDEEDAHLKKKTLLPVKGTLQVHQVCWGKHNTKLMFRRLSCFSCDVDKICKEYHLTSLEVNQDGDNILAQISTKELQSKPTEFPEYQVGDWVAVIYDGILYPGEITSTHKNGVEVNVMHPTMDKTKYKWPENPDKHFYEYNDIIKSVNPPMPCSNRAAFFYFDDF